MPRTPKRLVVFCNGAPTVQHTVVLDKRITPTFESILEYISEVIQFHVVKLHMLDGRRVSMEMTHAKQNSFVSGTQGHLIRILLKSVLSILCLRFYAILIYPYEQGWFKALSNHRTTFERVKRLWHLALIRRKAFWDTVQYSMALGQAFMVNSMPANAAGAHFNGN